MQGVSSTLGDADWLRTFVLPTCFGSPQASFRALRSRLSSQSVGWADMKSICAWRVAISSRSSSASTSMKSAIRLTAPGKVRDDVLVAEEEGVLVGVLWPPRHQMFPVTSGSAPDEHVVQGESLEVDRSRLEEPAFEEMVEGDEDS